MTQRRIYQDEYPYFITTNVWGKEPFFHSVRYTNQLYEGILFSCKIKYFMVMAFQIMPDHLHLLVMKRQRTLERVRWGDSGVVGSPSERTLSSVRSHKEANISDLLQSIKGSFSHKVKYDNIWQRRFNSRIINSDERLRNTINYIRNNPIKAKLPSKYHAFPYQYFNWELIHQLF